MVFNVKSETITNEPSVISYIKIHWYVLYFDESLTHAWFCNFMHWLIRKHWFIELCIPLYNIKKSHLLIISLISSEKYLSIGKL